MHATCRAILVFIVKILPFEEKGKMANRELCRFSSFNTRFLRNEEKGSKRPTPTSRSWKSHSNLTGFLRTLAGISWYNERSNWYSVAVRKRSLNHGFWFYFLEVRHGIMNAMIDTACPQGATSKGAPRGASMLPLVGNKQRSLLWETMIKK